MKTKTLLLGLALWGGLLSAQENLVPNPSFEEYYNCDYEHAITLLEDILPHWWARRATPGYHHPECTTLPYDAYDGVASIALVPIAFFDDSTGISRRDLAQTILLEDLSPSKNYYLEYYVRVRSATVDAVSHHGVLFSDSLVLDATSNLPVPHYPLITVPDLEVDTIVGNYENWTRVWHCFTPGEQRRVMTVGVFAPGDSVKSTGSFSRYSYDAFYLIEVPDTLSLLVGQDRDTICVGECVELSSSHSRVPGDFYWELPGSDVGTSTDSVVTACYAEPGTYDVRLEAEHCHGAYARTFERAVTVLPRPALPPEPVQRYQIAEGDSLLLSACHEGGGWPVRWSPAALASCADCPSTLFTGQESAVLQAIAGGPCADTCTYEIEVLPRAEARFTDADAQACEGGCFRIEGQSLHAEGGAQYFFAGASGEVPADSAFELCAPGPGTYDAVFVVGNAVSSDTFRLEGLEVLAYPERLPADTSLQAKAGQELQLEAGFEAAAYEWRELSGRFELACTGCPAPLAVPYLSGSLLLTAANGPCADSLRYDIEVERQAPLMYVPNGFSPNGDGRNDEFRPYGKFFALRRLQVYDRYGGLLFEAKGPGATWDGRAADGRPAMPGTYTYLIEYEDIYGEARTASGAVSLVR